MVIGLYVRYPEHVLRGRDMVIGAFVRLSVCVCVCVSVFTL